MLADGTEFMVTTRHYMIADSVFRYLSLPYSDKPLLYMKANLVGGFAGCTILGSKWGDGLEVWLTARRPEAVRDRWVFQVEDVWVCIYPMGDLVKQRFHLNGLSILEDGKFRRISIEWTIPGQMDDLTRKNLLSAVVAISKRRTLPYEAETDLEGDGAPDYSDYAIDALYEDGISASECDALLCTLAGNFEGTSGDYLHWGLRTKTKEGFDLKCIPRYG